MRWSRRQVEQLAVAVISAVLLSVAGLPGGDTVEAQSPLPKPTTGPTRAAQPSTDPRDMLAAQLGPRLRAGAANVFAGLYGAPDGAIQVFVTVDTPAVRAIVAESVESVRAASPPGRPIPAVRVVPGKANSLAELQRIMDAVGARDKEFRARGIEVTGYGVSITKNRTSIGVKTFTLQIKAYLEGQFGASKVHVVQQDYSQLLIGPAVTPPSTAPSVMPARESTLGAVWVLLVLVCLCCLALSLALGRLRGSLQRLIITAR